jgi:asparagine synthase (glutamine-hydrolysing)
MDWNLVIYLFYYGAGAKYFALEMKALKDDCERFEIFPLGHIYSSKSN